jgi:DNA-binding CsgD family transcriptional regulator
VHEDPRVDALARGVDLPIGRDDERAKIGQLLERARGDSSAVLVLRGEAGIGKTTLLDTVVASAADFELVRVVGIESEMRIGYAGLHLLLRSFLDDLENLPPPQARALKAAIGISDQSAPDQFLIALAALTLLTDAAAARGPLLIVVDDAQWLDHESGRVLGFLARRLHADRICLLISLREPINEEQLFEGLPSMTLGGLTRAASELLLEATLGTPVDEGVRTRLLAEARGNPLALREFGRQLSSDQLAGEAPLPPALPVDRALEAHFLRQVALLPPATQRLLLAVAAEPTADSISVLRAGDELDFDETAIGTAQAAGLLESGPALAFRHPLIRSAVYQGALPAERSRVHAAWATAIDVGRDPDRRAWHRAAATPFPDDDVAAELERAAQFAASRGGTASSAALLARAADLTLGDEQRAVRLLGAAAAELSAGNTSRARTNLARARPHLRDPLLVASALRLEGAIAFVGSDGGTGESVSKMIEAARALGEVDVSLARDVILDTLPMAIYFGHSSPVAVSDVADLARSFEPPAGSEPTAVDLMLDAIVAYFTQPYRSAVPLLRRALAAVRSDAGIHGSPHRLARACYIPQAISDDEAFVELAAACVATSREQGSFQSINEGLAYLYLHQLRAGSLDGAADIIAEERELQSVLPYSSRSIEARELIVSAWRGREAAVRAGVAELELRARDLGYVVGLITHAQVVLEIGLGNYGAASSVARVDWRHDASLGALRAADAIEAHVRSDNCARAEPAMAHLEERAGANGSAFDMGLLARGRALLADDAHAEEHFRSSISWLRIGQAKLHAARSELLYGEWLRRQKRRRDAREHLAAAHDVLDSMGARGFAARARIELFATGERARKRVDDSRLHLTPQESQIARLAAGGLTNAEIAGRLFISASTVDYHLRKVYRKLDLRSRHELRRALAVD